MDNESIISQAQKILMVLLKHGEMTLSDISFKGNFNRQTVTNNVRILLQNQLVTEKREEGFPPRRLISLTEKGRKVAEKLEEIEKILR
ncbi:MAG: MarR family transcriptional regulator [Candidatus Methanosuratincola petrocarbonis]